MDSPGSGVESMSFWFLYQSAIIEHPVLIWIGWVVCSRVTRRIYRVLHLSSVLHPSSPAALLSHLLLSLRKRHCQPQQEMRPLPFGDPAGLPPPADATQCRRRSAADAGLRRKVPVVLRGSARMVAV